MSVRYLVLKAAPAGGLLFGSPKRIICRSRDLYKSAGPSVSVPDFLSTNTNSSSPVSPG
jgi:hypothetical protein